MWMYQNTGSTSPLLTHSNGHLGTRHNHMSTVALLLMTTGGFQVVKATNQSFTLPAISATYTRVDYSLFEGVKD